MLVQVFHEETYQELWKYVRIFDSLPTEEKYTILATFFGTLWLIWFIRRPRKTNKAPKKKKTRLPQRPFTTDGYYWDPDKKKWIEPDFKDPK